MKGKFGDRLKGAMLAAGFATASQLAKACGASRQTVVSWLAMDTPRLSALRALRLAECLRVRMRWMLTGNGIAGWELHAREQDLERAVVILEKLSPKQVREWLKIGERMANGG